MNRPTRHPSHRTAGRPLLAEPPAAGTIRRGPWFTDSLGPTFHRLAAVLCLAAALPLQAQVVFPRPPAFEATRQQGRHYYLIENLTLGVVAQRGTAGAGGFAFDRLTLPPNTRFRLWILQAASLDAGYAEFATPATGRAFEFPAVPLGQPVSSDDDNDDLHADGEFIMGTDPANPDSDGDGILDGAEVRQGLDPLSGRAARTGIIGTADTPGTAQDICAVNDLAIVADGAAGISVFNIFNAMNPVIIAQVDTPGIARAVSCDGNLIAVADGPAGLAIIDIDDPPAAGILRQMNLGSDARAVSVSADLAFVGLLNGQVVVADIETGGILNRVNLGAGAVQDVLVLDEAVYALTVGRLHVLSFREGVVTKLSEVASPGAIGAAQRRLRLSGGGDRLQATFTSGFNVFDLGNPGAPVLLRQHTTAQFGWKQLVANGSGLGFAAVSPNSTDDGPHHVSLHRLDPAGTNAVFLAEFPTPGLAAAVAIYNGQGYVADSGSGLQVVNYLAFDNQRQPPTIRLESNFSLNRAEEGKRMRIAAVVTDDVQVRNVEFYVDGRKLATDGNFPFATSFVTPRAGARSLSLRARASDTGGNATWTDEITVDIVPDATPPFITRTVPAPGAIVGNLGNVTAFFSEPMDLASLGSDAFALVGNGPDDLPDTTDDAPVPGGTFSYRDALNAVTLTFATTLPPGGYRLRIADPLSDLAGNPVRTAFTSGFRIFSGEDVDQDGVPDELESALGLVAGNPDSDGDGILDGDEDFDRDGLTNAGEILLTTDATNPDTDGDGIRDGDEDTDGDSLTDGQEIAIGSSPTLRDTDGDEWTDDAEFLVGSDLTDSRSRPFLPIISQPVAGLLLPSLLEEEPGLAFGPWLSRPPLGVVLPNDQDSTGFVAGTLMAFPPVSVVLNGLGGDAGFAAGTLLARPPVSVVLPRVAEGDSSSETHLALPPVRARIDN